MSIFIKKKHKKFVRGSELFYVDFQNVWRKEKDEKRLSSKIKQSSVTHSLKVYFLVRWVKNLKS